MDGQKVLLIGQAALIGYTVVMDRADGCGVWKQTSMVKRFPVLLTAGLQYLKDTLDIPTLGKLR